MGSVFSPYYAAARRKGPADPENHVALNVCLYGGANRRWTLTERGRAGLARDATNFAVGPSSIERTGDGLLFRIDEIGMPIPRRVRGTVRVRFETPPAAPVVLSPSGGHRWFPFAPRARVEVELQAPDLRWSGDGYVDGNSGDAPLERDFVSWDWSRAAHGRDTLVLYDARLRNGGRTLFVARFAPDGGVEPLEPPPAAALPRTAIWRVARGTRADGPDGARVLETLEDTPFYARSTIETRIGGAQVRAMHESLSLDRFAARWVQTLLPFRMPRVRR